MAAKQQQQNRNNSNRFCQDHENSHSKCNCQCGLLQDAGEYVIHIYIYAHTYINIHI
jgi:hypothetical protein